MAGTDAVWSASAGDVAGGGKGTATLPAAEPGFDLGDDWLRPFLDTKSLDELFAMVAGAVRFEPYEGLLRGAVGTALARRGNSLDQALLLKRVLDMQGYVTRLAEGDLDRPNVLVLLRGMYPPSLPTFAYGEEYAPFQPEDDAELVARVKRHYWVELRQGDGSWLPLDPSFPRARIGEAYAAATQRHEQPPEEWFHRISIRMLRKSADGSTETLFRVEKEVAELGYMPLSLSCIAIPLEEAREGPARRGAASDLFGSALGGGTVRKKEEPPAGGASRLGSRYRWVWRVRGEGARYSSHDVLTDRAESRLLREWLEITVRAPGGSERRVERTLYEANGDSRPAPYRRYLLMVLPGAVRPEFAEAIDRQFAALPVAEWRQLLARRGDDRSNEAALALDEVLASRLLQTMIMRFAVASDEMMNRVGYRNGLVVSHATPRVLIASAVTAGDTLRLDMDLRLDDVDAIPFPGAPARLVRLFQIGRGLAQSAAEGEVLRLNADITPLTTAALMGEAEAQAIPIRVVDEESADAFIRDSAMAAPVAGLLRQSVSAGWEAVIPERPVRIAGADRWGWWRIEKDSGRTIGVMDNGLNAGLTGYTLSSEHIGLNPNMGFAVGMVVGSVSTLFTVSALMLEYGETSTAMVKAVENHLRKVLCASCPKAEAKAEASITDAGYCLKAERKLEKSAKVNFNFCDKYADGFKCAAGLLLHGVSGPSREYKVEASWEAGCSAGKAGAGAKHGL